MNFCLKISTFQKMNTQFCTPASPWRHAQFLSQHLLWKRGHVPWAISSCSLSNPDQPCQFAEQREGENNLRRWELCDVRASNEEPNKQNFCISTDSAFCFSKPELLKAFYHSWFLEFQKKPSAHWRRVRQSLGHLRPFEICLFIKYFSPKKRTKFWSSSWARKPFSFLNLGQMCWQLEDQKTKFTFH